ncbi:energy transducer TonB [Winogradskyella litorisediminis]|uniref:Energy transducer TonB n=1 Tax=Winogradskyella litorisediminis TaxID=1156618 RepID=A0ABW3N5Q6_9FLAO
MLYYILQIVAFQLVFLIIYDVFLKRETFFNYNRIYLLGTAILSFVLPFIKFKSLKTVAPKDFVIVLPEVFIGSKNIPSQTYRNAALQAGIEISEPTMPIWQIVFFLGMAIATLFFAYKLSKLFYLKAINPKHWQENILIVNLIKSVTAFSFFNTIFIGENISNQDKPTILKHELVHVKQWHSLDLMLFEVMRILLWFNPLVYMYQNRIKALHEYIADEIAVKQTGKQTYYNQLLNQVFETQNMSFTNTFFNTSLIKKRIAMLQKSKSKKAALIKYALIIPMVLGMLIYTSAEVKAQTKETIVETIEVQEISEKSLIQKYYKELKKLYDADDIDKIMKFSKADLNNFKMTLDEFARFKAFGKVMFEDRINEKIKSGTATDSEKKMLKNSDRRNESYTDYLARTKTEEYGKQWETRTKGSTLKLYVKDLKNKTKEEEKRFEEKVDLIIKDPFWTRLLISDGNQSQTIVIEDGQKEPVSKINSADDVEIIEVQESIEVPYAVIENVPTFPACKDLTSNEEKKHCTSKNVAMFVNKNFNTNLATQLGLEGRQRISVFFKIDKEGNVTSIGARAPHPQLEEEAKRVIGLLPQFIPGTQKGKPVVVPYALPIVFQVNTNANTVSKTPNYDVFKNDLQDKKDYVPFAEADKIPTYEECKNLTSNKEKRSCTANEIAMFVNKNFNLDLAKKLGLKGRQRIAVVFMIGKDGKIHSASARAPHPKLEEEAVRVINMLPVFIPGEHKGKKVDVIYKLPILFQVQG